MSVMRIRQYAYFAIKSETLSPAEIERQVGLPADRVRVLGERTPEAPRPAAHHIWELRCDQPGLKVDEQIASLVARLQPVRSEIANLVTSGHAVAVLQLVRFFHDPEGEEEVPSISEGMRKLSGQHQLLGWDLDEGTMSFLLSVGANLNVDEYG